MKQGFDPVRGGGEAEGMAVDSPLGRMSALGQRLARVATLVIPLLLLVPVLRWWPDWLWPNSGFGLCPPASIGLRCHADIGLSLGQRLAGTAVECGLLLLVAWVLLALRRLGLQFATGEGLTLATARAQRLLGRRLLWLALAQFLYGPLVTLAVTLFNRPGEMILTVGISGMEISLLVAALVVFLSGWATEAAAAIAEENAQII
jgi:hypothetical protein